MFNGATGGLIPARWHHANPDLYPDRNRNGLQDDYWWLPFDIRLGMHEVELWAGYYADQMLFPTQECPPLRVGWNLPPNLQLTEEVFPTAVKALDALAQEIKDS